MSTLEGLQPYPFRRSRDYLDSKFPITLSDEATTAISEVEKPIVEIGGPTVDGYRMLGDSPVLPRMPIITDCNFYGNGVEQVDGTAMPYPDESVGMFLMSHMGSTNFPAFEEIERRKGVFGVMKQQERWGNMAEEELDRLIADPTKEPRFSLPAGILKEVQRTLEPGGVLLYENVGDKGIAYAKGLGLEVVQQEREGSDKYSCLFKKPSVKNKSL